jgi:phage anti-repressor protein
MGPSESYKNGIRKISELVSMVGYKREYPDHYRLFSKEYLPIEHEYITAVDDNDTTAAARLVVQTRFAFEVRAAMTLPDGCALISP